MVGINNILIKTSTPRLTNNDPEIIRLMMMLLKNINDPITKIPVFTNGTKIEAIATLVIFLHFLLRT